MHLIARMLLVVRPGAPSSFLFLVAMPGAPSSVVGSVSWGSLHKFRGSQGEVV